MSEDLIQQLRIDADKRNEIVSGRKLPTDDFLKIIAEMARASRSQQGSAISVVPIPVQKETDV